MKIAERKAKRLVILELMRSGMVSVLDVSAYLFKTSDDAFMETAENLLNEMWDLNLCVCMGHYHDYKYQITTQGEKYLLANA
jgi:hypothetical protein